MRNEGKMAEEEGRCQILSSIVKVTVLTSSHYS